MMFKIRITKTTIRYINYWC